LKTTLWCLWIVCLFLIYVILIQQLPAESQKNSGAVERATILIDEFRKVGDIPGITVAVGKKNEVVWEAGFGFSDLENSVPVNAKSRFRLGSVSKMITIAAAMRLVERGVLDLDAPIAKYLSSIPEQYGKLTIRQLAGHLAGVRHYKLEDFQFDLKHFDSVNDSLKIFTGDPLLHEPTTKYLYSTYGYVLISAVVEAAAGKEFLQIVDQEVFGPLKMSRSGPDLLREVIPNKTRYYERAQGKIKNAPYEDPSYKWAAGGMIASAGDLVRFGMAHLHPGYLKQEILDQVFKSQSTSDGKETDVGIGWRIGSDWRGRRIYHHAGNISGGRAVLVLYPQEDLAIAFLSNVSSQPAFVESTAQMIAENFADQDGKTFESVPKDLSGLYELSGSNQGKPYSAKLELRRHKQNYQGSITGDFPMLDTAVKNGLPGTIRVSSVWIKDKNPALILVSPFGVLEMLLKPAGQGYQYSVDEGPAKFEGELKRRTSP
jgi:serine beta-lactamase-like protein LACTB